MHGKSRYALVGLSLLTALLLVMVGGCQSCGERIAREALEKTIEQGTGGNVEIDKQGGQITITGQDGEQGAVTFGENVALPDNWPAEANIYGGAKPVMVMVSEEGAFGTFQSNDDVDKIAGYYDGFYKSQGWTQTGTVATPMGKTLVFTKDNKNCTVTVSPAESAGQPTTFTLTYTVEKS